MSGLILANKIYGVIPNGFASYFVCGSRGIGKSAYSLKVLHEVFLRLGYSDDDAWTESLNCIKFSIPDVIKYLQDAVKTDSKKIALLWDDVRVFGGSTQYFINMRLVDKLKGMLDTMRTAVNCVILTCPNTQGLLGILKSYDDYQIAVKYSEKGGWYRRAVGYLWTSLPSGKRLVYKKFEDSFSCYLPNHVFEIYNAQRKKALADILVDLEKDTDKEDALHEK
jgi:hypothetical protein